MVIKRTLRVMEGETFEDNVHTHKHVHTQTRTAVK